MQTETQKNWNEYWGRKKKRNFRFPIIILMLLIITAIFAYLNPLHLNSRDLKGIAADLLNIHDPYRDGEMMNAMIKEVDNMENQNDEYINQLLSYNAEKPDPVFLNNWGSFLDKSLRRLDEMHYHPSYSAFISACRDMLEESEALQQSVLTKDVINSIGDTDTSDRIDKIYTYYDQIDDELMRAFDNNGVEYYEADDYIHYSYN